ncbi:MAG: HlyD family efflux transporter periplasmic adaptor subunit [Cyclobacteriaceae bacterium]|nr:HlyD family efflux transporter periplasmic adaptor subunit [Cyclobacteriaceae bacterium]
MDKKIKKKKWTVKRLGTYGLIGLFAGFIVYQLFFTDRRSTLKVDKEKITISVVKKGVFQDYIPQTGNVEPSKTIYLDAIEGGTISKVIRQSGAMVAKGDVILSLSNLNRELQVLGQEATLNESINRVRQTRLSLSQNDLAQQQQLALIRSQLSKVKPRFEREKMLFSKELISQQQFEQTEADYNYAIQSWNITYAQYKMDSLDRIRQVKQLNNSEGRMMESLNGVGKILANLVIRSPLDGQLSTKQLEEGQAVMAGERLGQVDIIGSFKVRVPIDELYLPRIATGLGASTRFNNQDYNLKITYIYPTINNGRFEVDMDFVDGSPKGIKRGQSLRMKIELGQSSEELLVPVGGFYKDTGGNWIFVVDESGTKAERREIRIGRKNSEYYEVLEGIEPGEKVITSSYDTFGDNEVLILG